MKPKSFLDVKIGPGMPKVASLPAREDALYRAKREITHLKHEISRLESRIRRLVEDVEWEIDGWESALDSGQREESIEAIKRRISRLRGAIAYPGIVNFDARVDALEER